ncbi:MAG: nucleoside phosphorylase [Acidobacteriota bacterium]|nr:nucleoside phosphorylase [Acidobacteriota bacterium]
MTRVAVVAAIAGELEPLVKGWQHESRNGVDLWRWRHDEGEWVAACAGAGVAAATRAIAEIEKNGPVSFFVSTGWAGALRAEIEPGRVYNVSGVIDARTGERFRVAAGPEGPWLVTSPVVAGEAEKSRLASAYNADLVDMEAAAVARLAGIRAVPFYCIKGISDGFADQLPDFNRFLSPSGQFRLARFVVFALLRPWLWFALARMNENSRKASRGIAESLFDFLDERGHIRKRNGYPNFKR